MVTRVNALGLPSLFGMREFVDEGGLMSYGERFADTYRHAAPYRLTIPRVVLLRASATVRQEEAVAG